MNPDLSTVVVAYDIPATLAGDRRRARLHKALVGFGTPIQRSVFECALRPAELRRMREAVMGIIRPRTDSVVLYRLCGSCRGRTESVPGRKSASPSAVRIV